MDEWVRAAPVRVALVGFVVLMLGAPACTSDDGGAAIQAGTMPSTSSTTTTAEETTMPTTTVAATETTAPVDPVPIVMNAIAAWNTGDFDAWLAFWGVERPEADDLFSRSVMNSNEHMDVTGRCEVSAVDAGTVSVLCPVFVEDDFHGPGGLTSDGTMRFLLDNDGAIVETESTTYRVDGVCCPEWQGYHTAFHLWLAGAYPDVYEQIGPPVGVPLWYLPGYASGDAEHMKIALEYVEEFVARSDVYPLDSGGT